MAGDGFSGSQVWRVDELDGGGESERSFVLKAFPEGWPRSRAESVHRYARLLIETGIPEIPRLLPLAAPAIGSIVEDAAGGLWELAEFRSGRPVAMPTPEQAREALVALGRIHLAAAGPEAAPLFPAPTPAERGPGGVPAWERRRQRLLRVSEHGWRRPRCPAGSPLRTSIDARRAEAAATLERFGGRATLARLAALAGPMPRHGSAVPLQPVLRDVWQSHLLFEGSRVSAVIDLHAAGIDSPATDLARLLGSWRPGPAPLGDACPTAGEGAIRSPRDDACGRLSLVWKEALDAYRSVRPLAAAEVFLIDLLHVGGVIGGLDSWFQWVLDDGKAFGSPLQVGARVDFLLENLDSVLRQADSLLQRSG